MQNSQARGPTNSGSSAQTLTSLPQNSAGYHNGLTSTTAIGGNALGGLFVEGVKKESSIAPHKRPQAAYNPDLVPVMNH